MSEKQRQHLIDMIDTIKDKVSRANDYAEKHGFTFVTRTSDYNILDLSCICDEIIGELERGGGAES